MKEFSDERMLRELTEFLKKITMKVLMISNDPKILQKGATFPLRVAEYAKQFEELHTFIRNRQVFFEVRLLPQ